MRSALLWAVSAVVLNPTQLRSVKSVACLQLLHRDPTADCANPHDRDAPTARGGDSTPGQWFIGTGGYPTPDAVLGVDDPGPCSSDGEYFCDPDGVLPPEQQAAVRADLRFVRENNLVSCPIPGVRARAHAPNPARPDDEVDYLLGVAIMRTLPTSELDDESLQKFGESVLDSWSLRSGDCDRAAVLVVVTDAERAWLAAPTCRFFCGAGDRPAGVEAGRRVLAKLTSDGSGKDWGGRLQAAIREVSEVLHVAQGVERSREMPQDWAMTAYLRRKEKEWRKADAAMQWAVRAVIILAAVGIVLWHWQWVKAAVPYGAGKLAHEDPAFECGRSVYVHATALLLLLPLLLYWGICKALRLAEELVLFILSSAFGVASTVWQTLIACLASVTEPCFNLVEPGGEILDQAVEPLDAIDAF